MLGFFLAFNLQPLAKGPVKSHYGECKDVDLSSLSEKQESTSGEFCFLCPLQNLLGFKEIKQATTLTQSEIFKQKLQKRVIGQIETKIFQTQMLKACISKDRNFFNSKGISWSDMNQTCNKKSQELKNSVKQNWSQMRVDLSLSRPSLREDRILSDRGTWFDFTPSHLVSKFDKTPKLSPQEIQQAEKRYIEVLSKVSLESLSSSELKEGLEGKKPLYTGEFYGEKNLTNEDQNKLKTAEQELRKKAKKDYLNRMSRLPLLGYLKSANPSQKEWGEAFSKVEKSLQEFLGKAKDKPVDMGLMLSFAPLVKELLKEDKSFCLSAERARLKAKKNESLKNWALLGAGVLSAVPCFITGPIGAGVCLSAGMTLGVVGHSMAKNALDDSLGRLLTGEDFETMAGLEGKAKEEFLAKLFLPLAAWGTTAVPARAVGTTVSKVIKNRTSQSSSSSQVIRQSTDLNAPVTKTQKKRMLKAYNSLLKNKSAEEQNVIMSAIRGMESKGLGKEKISEKISQATKQCQVK